MTAGDDALVSSGGVVSTEGVSREAVVCGIAPATLFGGAAGIIRGAAENIERDAGFVSPASFTWTSAVAVLCGVSRRSSSWTLSGAALTRSTGFSWDVASG